MAKFKHHIVEKDGDWSEWVYPNRKNYKMACCDCCLVHDMQFDLVKRGLGKAIVFRVRRNNKSTGQMRKAILKKASEKMLIDGKWLDNITCKKCRHRHPKELTCFESEKLAESMRLEKEKYEANIFLQEDKLTDKEIFEIFADDPDILTFARACIKKAREK